MPRVSAIAFGVLVLPIVSAQAMAQPSEGWATRVEGLAIFQDDADLSEGGSFSANRSFLRASALYRFGTGSSVGVSGSVGQFDYDFGPAVVQPWGDVRDYRLSVPVRVPIGNSASLFVSPQVRWDYERGASSSDGRTYGAFTGIAWRINDQLTIGPAFGAFSQLREVGTRVFPALLVDWDINDRWNLTTGTGLGATSGPGLSLSYQHSDAISVSLTSRIEEIEFRLNDDGIAPGGTGEDESVPVVVSVDYNPNPALALSVFAGAELDGELSAYGANGALLSEQEYDTAPIAGVAFQFQF